MKIDLEKYIRSNRSQLDDVEHIDIDQMWMDFDQEEADGKDILRIGRTVNRNIRPWYMLVAAVIVVLLGASVFLNNASQSSQDDLVYQKLSEIDPVLAAEQVSMIRIVSIQDSTIKNLGITEAQFPELFDEIRVLDSLQMDYLNDLDNYRDRKNLTRTLLRHYQRKARVLELMLYEFDKKENESAYESAKEI